MEVPKQWQYLADIVLSLNQYQVYILEYQEAEM